MNTQITFVTQHNLWTAAQQAAAEEVKAAVKENDLDLIRLSFADQHGILRGKAVFADGLDSYFRNGCTMTTTLLLKDTSHRTIFPVWQSGAGLNIPEFEGAGNFIMVPDPTTFRILPWADKTGWMLCDIYMPNGSPVPFCTRRILRNALDRLDQQGYHYIAGLEVECHLFKLEDPKLTFEQTGHPPEPPAVSLLAHGFQYLTEHRQDELEPALALLRRDLMQLDLPLRSIEVEFGPSQIEFTFDADDGMRAADNMVLFRSAVKQIAHRHGYHATFMCRPGLPEIFSSGWHLHQSLVDKVSGSNVLMPDSTEHLLSQTGQQFVAGILENAQAACLFTTPTINGYKRYRPFTLAPDRVLWGHDNKGAMLRILGGPGDAATRIENRVGEPAANPYLYMMSQVVSGLAGLEEKLVPATPANEPYSTDAPRLPQSLMDAVAHLRANSLFRAELGDQFVDYMIALKEFEISRFLSEVTNWEQREYFDLY